MAKVITHSSLFAKPFRAFLLPVGCRSCALSPVFPRLVPSSVTGHCTSCFVSEPLGFSRACSLFSSGIRMAQGLSRPIPPPRKYLSAYCAPHGGPALREDGTRRARSLLSWSLQCDRNQNFNSRDHFHTVQHWGAFFGGVGQKQGVLQC